MSDQKQTIFQTVFFIAKEPFSGSSNTAKTFSGPMSGFVIYNDGNNDLTFTIAGDTYTVKGKEMFQADFEPFTTVTITSAVPFRAYGKKPVCLGSDGSNGITCEDWAGNEPVELPDREPPLNVTNVNITNIDQTGVTLNWTESESLNTKDYTIYNGSTLITTVTATASKLQPLSYRVTGLAPGTNYTFAIKARDTSGNEASGVSISVSTLGNQVLFMNGTSDYIKLPSMTFDTVELTCQINLKPNTEQIYIDARPGVATAYFGVNSAVNIQYGPVWTKVLVNGAVPRNIADIKNIKTKFTLTVGLSAPGKSEITIFSNYKRQFPVQGKIYEIKVYNGASLMASYNLTEAFSGTSIIDTSGNNQTALLSGGTWVTE